MTRTKKILASFAIAFLVLGLLFVPAKNAQASAIFGDPWQFIKQFVIYPLVRAIANSFESKLINQLNKQVSGVGGAVPSFITNWRNHLLDSQARGNDVFRSVLADANICGFMSNNVKTAFGADLFAGSIAGATVKDASGKVVYKNETNAPGMASFQETAKCTLPANFDVSAFNQNFSKGGWAAWDSMLEPQNNLFGIYTMALGEQQAQIATEQTSTMNSAVAGNGFLASKLSTALGLNGASTGPTGCTDTAGVLGNGAQGPVMTTRCTFMGKDVTPAYLKAGGVGQAIGAKIGQPAAAKEITDVVLGLFTDVLNVVQNAAGSLGNYLGQATYNSTVGSMPGFDTAQKQPGAGDAQINQAQQQVNQTSTQLNQKESATASSASGTCSSNCMSGKQATCTTNNQTTTCTPVTDPVTNQTTQSCQTTTDQAGYNACVSQAQTDCNNQCPAVPVDNNWGQDKIPPAPPPP